MTRELDFLKRLYCKHIPAQSNKYWFKYSIQVRTTKKTSQFQFNPDTPTLAYHQHDQNNCCFSSLAFDFVV